LCTRDPLTETIFNRIALQYLPVWNNSMDHSRLIQTGENYSVIYDGPDVMRLIQAGFFPPIVEQKANSLQWNWQKQ